jgi:hypothetical protein
VSPGDDRAENLRGAFSLDLGQRPVDGHSNDAVTIDHDDRARAFGE